MNIVNMTFARCVEYSVLVSICKTNVKQNISNYRRIVLTGLWRTVQRIYTWLQQQQKQSCLLCNFFEIALWHGCSPLNLLYIFRTSFPKNTSGGLLLLQTQKGYSTWLNVKNCSDSCATLEWHLVHLFH